MKYNSEWLCLPLAENVYNEIIGQKVLNMKSTF